MKLSRFKWSFALSLFIIIIIATNYVDRHNFEKLQKSITTIYEDRLVVNDIIFELNLLLQEKEMAVIEANTAFFKAENKRLNRDIKDLVERFKATQLVPDEASTLTEFEENLQRLYRLETEMLVADANPTQLQQHLNRLETNLSKLSKIQLEEGRRQLFIGKKAVASIDLYTKMEVYILIFLAALLLFTLLYHPKKAKLNREDL